MPCKHTHTLTRIFNFIQNTYIPAGICALAAAAINCELFMYIFLLFFCNQRQFTCIYIYVRAYVYSETSEFKCLEIHTKDIFCVQSWYKRTKHLKVFDGFGARVVAYKSFVQK